MRRRLDLELVRRGLAPTRERARDEIEAGRVTVAGAPAEKPARLVAPGEALRVAGPPEPFVGRGGAKLAAALDRFGVAVEGREALDAGASTGGFTDCLLSRGAASVLAVDVGHGQLDPRLRADPRVTVVERTNIRHANLKSLGRDGRPLDLVVADLSFISLRTVATALLGLTAAGSDVVVLVKPQFEAGRVEAAKGSGVISDPAIWAAAMEGVVAAFEQPRPGGPAVAMLAAMVSPLLGPAGNVEFLAHFGVGIDVKVDDMVSGKATDLGELMAEAAGMRRRPA